MTNMMLGEVIPGGAGSGLYGLVVMALVAVFLGGLMVGTTPEYLQKRLNARHMKLISIYLLVLPVTILVGCAVAMALPAQRASMLNGGPHGLSEVLYAFTSSAANNGSAFGGFSGNTVWYNVVLAVVMVAGRFVPIIAVMALAGTFATHYVKLKITSQETHGTYQNSAESWTLKDDPSILVKGSSDSLATFGNANGQTHVTIQQELTELKRP